MASLVLMVPHRRSRLLGAVVASAYGSFFLCAGMIGYKPVFVNTLVITFSLVQERMYYNSTSVRVLSRGLDELFYDSPVSPCPYTIPSLPCLFLSGCVSFSVRRPPSVPQTLGLPSKIEGVVIHSLYSVPQTGLAHCARSRWACLIVFRYDDKILIFQHLQRFFDIALSRHLSYYMAIYRSISECSHF